MALEFGGSTFQLTKLPGTIGTVQNILYTDSLYGARLATALPFNVALQFGQRSLQLSPVTLVNYLRLGSLTPSKVYLGTTEVSKIYLGTNLVYQS